MSDFYDDDEIKETEIEKIEKGIKEDDLTEQEAQELQRELERYLKEGLEQQESEEDEASHADKKQGRDQKDEKKESEYEDVCFICRRPESKTGKMFKLPNNICVCNDCMHKTMDTVSQFDYQGMLNNNMFDNMGKTA